MVYLPKIGFHGPEKIFEREYMDALVESIEILGIQKSTRKESNNLIMIYSFQKEANSSMNDEFDRLKYIFNR